MRLPFWILACVAVFILNPAPTFAVSTTSGELTVSATVNASCNISDITNLAFGGLSAGMLPANTTSTFDVTCTPGVVYSIGLNKGFYGTSTTDRKMGSGTEGLEYELYSDADWASPWGDDTATSKSGLGSSGSAVTHTIYGKIPDQTWPAPGDYSDTVEITVSY